MSGVTVLQCCCAAVEWPCEVCYGPYRVQASWRLGGSTFLHSVDLIVERRTGFIDDGFVYPYSCVLDNRTSPPPGTLGTNVCDYYMRENETPEVMGIPYVGVYVRVALPGSLMYWSVIVGGRIYNGAPDYTHARLLDGNPCPGPGSVQGVLPDHSEDTFSCPLSDPMGPITVYDIDAVVTVP